MTFSVLSVLVWTKTYASTNIQDAILLSTSMEQDCVRAQEVGGAQPL